MNEIIFKPEGSLSFGTISVLQEQIKNMLKSLDGNTFVFDMSAIDKCDSAGLALLIDTVSKLKKQSVRYQFIGITTDICSLAKFYEVESLLKDAA